MRGQLDLLRPRPCAMHTVTLLIVELLETAVFRPDTHTKPRVWPLDMTDAFRNRLGLHTQEVSISHERGVTDLFHRPVFCTVPMGVCTSCQLPT
jgi:hypothetical protein